ncbi:hypothetical protein [Flavivirga sp. 57AJ16]|uniref:hypothetical protein n=1 Tax=Flavivirga sp. 57AJ16 TaxID=3025307 RepID=UPI002365DD10|nr:hypothetical protein [Flavivirga sp. 57AJ16]MDD7887050.1 hypothetical protein [Flavivirga sp. 57AJ16]
MPFIIKSMKYYEVIDVISISLFEAINSNPNGVNPLHLKLNELAILFSGDTRSILSIIIISTDNNGD